MSRVGELDLAGLEHSIAFALRLAQGASFGSFARRTQEAGLRPGHYAILHLIGANEGIAPGALSRATGRDKSTLTPIVAELLKSGRIRAEDCKKDRRSRKLFLTDKGRSQLAALERHAAAHDAFLDQIIGATNKPLLLKWLAQIVEALEADS
jgi:DNA-binding MarR family transcriptional regulator